MTSERVKKEPISLALSGGGIRAMAFHLGVLRALAECGELESVHRISTVSGGSLLVGLIYKEAAMRWPTSEQFLQLVYPALRSKLCQRSLQWGALRLLLYPQNWRFILSRVNLLSLALEHEWGISAQLHDVPAEPEWSINGTTAENGKRFRFKYDSIGDYAFGYAKPNVYPLSNALAVSAAFPGGFGPLKLKTKQFQWYKLPCWGAFTEEAQSVELSYKSLHLYDGGVYDNLGLEPFFDTGKGEPKSQSERIIVSDAGAPLKTGFSYFSLNPGRLKRVADIMSEQSRALRVRSFVKYLQKGSARGSYIYINTAVDNKKPSELEKFAINFPTTLRKLKTSEFDILANHGHSITNQVQEQYGL